MTTGLLTTAVGSFPKPAYLLEARAKAARGELDAAALAALERQATCEWLAFQEEIGVDLLVDGEMYRGDMVTYFAEHLEGFAISGLVRSYGNRYYRKPIAVGPIRRPRPITVEWFRFAQARTSRPVKGMLTGPYTLADWSFNVYYDRREDLVMALAEVVHAEALDLERAGARYIQIDEPAISTRPEELELAIAAMGVVTRGLTAHTITHLCYGAFEATYPRLLALPVDQIDLELANRGFELLELFRQHRFTKQIGLGVVDVHSHRIETKEEVKHALRRALEVLAPEQIYVDPDCGLKTRTVDEARAKMRVLVEATREVRRELGIAAA
jgi:5-methyltetrahydropteroyltriglutamate--homocysteine methyltransferase